MNLKYCVFTVIILFNLLVEGFDKKQSMKIDETRHT